MNTDKQPAMSLADELAAWRRQGAAVREKLLAERALLTEHLAQLDIAIADCGGDTTAPRRGRPRRESGGVTQCDIVWAALAQHADGAEARDIICASEVQRLGISPAVVRTLLCRLVTTRRAKASRSRSGGTLYRVLQRQQQEPKPPVQHEEEMA